MVSKLSESVHEIFTGVAYTTGNQKKACPTLGLDILPILFWSCRFEKWKTAFQTDWSGNE